MACLVMFSVVAAGLLACGKSPRPAPGALATDAATTPTTPTADTGTSPAPQAKLTWRTESEERTFGYYVERADSADGPFVRINEKTIAGHGDTNTPHDYEYVDTDVEAGETYYYRLWSMTYDGERELVISGKHTVKRADE
jgi:hypothetical protein